MIDRDSLAPRLVHWARSRHGHQAEALGVAPMPGNAGLSFGFDVIAEGRRFAYVIRLAPPGVRKQGNTDVLRQVPLLLALADQGIPVAPVVWSSGDESWFGTDAIVQERLSERPLHMYVREQGVQPVGDDVDPYLERAVHVLARIHEFDWEQRLVGWQQPRSSADEIEFWLPILDKAPEPAWRSGGSALHDALVATDPRRHRIGLCHGDYQTNNILFDERAPRIAAVVDWEIAGIGCTGLDVGWLAMMTDETCWAPDRRGDLQVLTEPGRIVEWYEKAAQKPLEHFAWYQALACFRFGTIAALNIRLHRSGRRVDADNERNASSVDALFRRGLALLEA